MDTKTSCNLFELQLNLENSLCLLTKKYNALAKKLSNSAQLDKKDDKSKTSGIEERRVSVSDGRPYKKIKLASEKSHKWSLSARAKGKRTQPAKSQENGFPGTSDIPKVQKNNDSSRFWAFVDCYCTAITMEDIKVLEKWIESHDKDTDYRNIPELGVHYSTKWMEDEILDEKKEGSKSMENPKGMDFTALENSPELELLRKKQDKMNSSYSEQPPLVEKLISSLVQENIITSPNDIMTECILDDNIQEKKLEGKTSQLDDSLESRLKSQLADIGALKADSEIANDELLEGLKRLQTLLEPISKLNLQKKKALLSRAKAEMAKQEAQKRIQETDAMVMESYRTMAATRLRGKKLSKKELSQIRNMLSERDALISNTRTDC